MTSAMKTVDVNVPVRVAYDQWTQFEDFPLFMENVTEINQLDDTKLQWTAEIDGTKEEWTAEITEQTPDQRIAWRSTSGAQNAGVVTFHKLDDNTSRVSLQMEYEPESAIEKAGAKTGVVDRTVEENLNNFKEFIEKRGRETGAWRGEVNQNS